MGWGGGDGYVGQGDPGGGGGRGKYATGTYKFATPPIGVQLVYSVGNGGTINESGQVLQYYFNRFL